MTDNGVCNSFVKETKERKCKNLDNNMKIFFKDTNFQNIVNSTDYVDIGMHK